MSDIVKRLRVPDEEWMPKGTRVILMYNNTLYEPDNFSLWYGSAIKLEAADEIERLRARIEVLELIRRYMGQGVSWDRAEEKAIDEIEERKARAALEAKP
jgi:hypothetical protein